MHCEWPYSTVPLKNPTPEKKKPKTIIQNVYDLNSQPCPVQNFQCDYKLNLYKTHKVREFACFTLSHGQ